MNRKFHFEHKYNNGINLNAWTEKRALNIELILVVTTETKKKFDQHFELWSQITDRRHYETFLSIQIEHFRTVGVRFIRYKYETNSHRLLLVYWQGFFCFFFSFCCFAFFSYYILMCGRSTNQLNNIITRSIRMWTMRSRSVTKTHIEDLSQEHFIVFIFVGDTDYSISLFFLLYFILLLYSLLFCFVYFAFFFLLSY